MIYQRETAALRIIQGCQGCQGVKLPAVLRTEVCVSQLQQKDSKRELYIQISEASRHSDLRISEISNKLDDTVDG